MQSESGRSGDSTQFVIKNQLLKVKIDKVTAILVIRSAAGQLQAYMDGKKTVGRVGEKTYKKRSFSRFFLFSIPYFLFSVFFNSSFSDVSVILQFSNILIVVLYSDFLLFFLL
jgi:hypothetical protein